MACNDFRSHISAVLDRRASAEERAIVSQHLEQCAACRAEMRQLEAVDAAVKSLPEPEAPAGYHESFLSRLTMKIDDQDKTEAKEKEPRKEDSGLLEIRKMASRTISKQMEVVQKSEVEEAVAAVSAVDIPAAVSQPIIVAPPKAQQKSGRGWLIPIVAVGALAAVAAVVFVMLPGKGKVLVRAPEPEGATPPVKAAFDPSAPPAAQPSSQPTAAAAGPAVALAPNEATPPKPAAAEPAAEEGKAKAAKEPREPAAKAREAKEQKEPREPAKAREAKEPKEAKPAKEKEPAAPAAKGEPELPVAPAPKPGKGADALDDLLRSGAAAKKEEKKAEPGEELPEALTPDQVQKGLNSVKGRVMACHDKYDVDGIAKCQVVIGKNGKVASVKMTGPFVGTPTGDCVAAAVRSASFPKFKGKPLSISYTYLLKR